MQSIKLSKDSAKSLPKSPGVYLFKNASGKSVYIGKAKSLNSRVLSYFATKLEEKTQNMIDESTTISFILVNSEIDALLLEARLVHQHQPKYNSQLKDDKTPLYVGITREQYPRVVMLRKSQLNKQKLRYAFGPFINAYSVRRLLKFLRKVFPYATHPPTNRLCFYNHLGQCDPCPSEIVRETNAQIKNELIKKYLKNLTSIRKVLSGDLPSMKNSIEKEMKEFSRQEKFEEAKILADKLKTIDYILTPTVDSSLYVVDPNLIEDIRKQEAREIKKILSLHLSIKKLQRIECYDVAHLAGVHPTASMVTFINGDPDKKYYRHFKVKKAKKRDDTGAMREVLERRMKHFDDWGKPDLIVIDGGKGQVSVAKEVLGSSVPVIGLAKRLETVVVRKPDGFKQIRLKKGPGLYLMQRLRDEAHRFARRYHHKLVSKAITG